MPTYRNSGFAGEMLAAAELARLGYEVLLGNVGSHRTTGVDLAAVDPDTGTTTAVSVKSLKSENSFLIDPVRVRHDAVYVFVVTHAAGHLPTFYVVRGATLLDNEERVWGNYGREYEPAGMRAVYPSALAEWQNNWSAIGG
jgi:hypothetical protein